ncbi:flagellar basal body rod protein FlgB [Clostridium saccharobutylicum]|uniref:Flagellar basal body rod protein FlgB n=1 Tax=Clostridium saccharobutylicum DSM 13864 TaxID=1345695 RepID=U5MVW9_CLOSA|nr:flagellar basal body rod protein FlgB [Clostridium saccharobutylicum]AGX44899.1 flagellar basal body rod protein FlgB [Clostridium saccharobutylicum DSM 13864]AQR92181.1 flagellar basal body rod protein FlgB [Clostridium saccharobutylicum]AQS02083.1 flagellar basal body rod protein FlgB [Clostridium saccharobutylicum]AQS11687.1 flagellar basal body rod protein FlgB [Clostridium saccharobutylicum]AQS16066.1 flagellar basal body rod protein FlgB [Clostridium saccharobutylicum]
MGIQSISSDGVYDLIKEGLKASNVRAKTIANNMANINTKDYKRFNVVFEENLKKNIDSSEFKLKRTRDVHFSDDNSTNDNISIEQDKSTSMRSDGNNVDLDIEKVNQAANTLKYNALITNINNKFNNLKTVMK